MIWQSRQFAFRWDAHRMVVMTGLALLAPLAAASYERGLAILAPLALAIGIAVFWHSVFTRLRLLPMEWDGIPTALIFILLAPDIAPLWQQGLALSFGIVMGDLVFGNRGRGFVNPTVVSLAFLLFSFPGTAIEAPNPSVAICAVFSGALLLAVGLLSWRVLVGFAVGAAALGMLLPASEVLAILQSASLVLGLVFLIGDVVAAACTNVGRWVYGGISGALVVLLAYSGEGADALAPVIFAALLASIFAPLIDQTVIWTNVQRRAQRQRNV